MRVSHVNVGVKFYDCRVVVLKSPSSLFRLLCCRRLTTGAHCRLLAIRLEEKLNAQQKFLPGPAQCVVLCNEDFEGKRQHNLC